MKPDCNDIFRKYLCMLRAYYNPITNTCDLEELCVACKITALDIAHATLYAAYIYEYWQAYTEDIMNGEYNYIHLTPMVYQSFREFMAK